MELTVNDIKFIRETVHKFGYPLNEIEKYGKYYSLYTKVKPGITGLWQVSGRNDVSYEERVALDAYYVRNWSVWLDLYILARTVPVAVFGKGAY